MFTLINKFFYKMGQIWHLQRQVWKAEIEEMNLREKYRQMEEKIAKIDREIEVEQDFISNLKDSHKYEDRKKIKKSEKKIKAFEDTKKFLKKMLSNPEAKNEKQFGIEQQIDKRLAVIESSKTLINLVKKNF